jgi:hypothetical protein
METKEAQKNLLTEIMDADAKDGLYKQQTATGWLVDQIKSDRNHKALTPKEWESVIKKAKAMEQLEIYAAYEAGWVNGDLKKAPRFGKDYYNNLYK